MDINIELATRQDLIDALAKQQEYIDVCDAKLATSDEKIASLENHIQVLTEKNEMLNEHIATLAEENSSLKNDKQVLTKKNEILNEHMDYLKQMLYGQRSEKRKPSQHIDDNQPSLFDFMDLPENSNNPTAPAGAESTEPEVETQTVTYTRQKRSGKKTKKSPVICREMVTLIDHPADDPTKIGDASDRTCSCGANLIKTGEKSVQKIEYIPGHFEEHIYHESIYSCPNCSGDEDQRKPVLPAALENEILPEAMATNNLIAEIIVNKFAYSLPLYRQNVIYLGLGVDLNIPTMCRWVTEAGELCKPLADEILHQIQSGETLNMDETRLQVLREKDRENTKQSQLWHMAGGRDGPCRFFNYNESRSGKVAAEYIGPFQGYLQTDGYAGYDAVGNRPGIIHVGCLDHIRRKFVAVTKCLAHETRIHSIADQILSEIAKIYRIERDLRQKENLSSEEKLSPEEFLQQRKKQVEPILSGIASIIEDNRLITPAKSLLGNALNYAYGQWNSFCNYLLHPALGPSNQLAENGIRPFVVGRKNFLFSGHPNGARALAIFYSLIETAKANKIRPLGYLNYVFAHIRSTPGDKMANLLPWKCDLG